MLKALMKKQLLELNAGYFMNRKTGKRRSVGGTIGYIALFAFIFLCLGIAVFGLAVSLCKPFCSVGLDWFYFALMGLLTIALSVFGSVFNTYAGLYLAKDNELLLSMPVKPSDILLVRMSGVYAMGMLYGSIVYLPTLAAWLIYGNVTVKSVISIVILFFMLGFVSLVLTCILGFLVALIALRVKNKSFITVLSSLIFIVGYYYIYFNITTLLQKILLVGQKAAEGFKSYAYITYIFGKASTGDLLDLLWFSLISLALFGITYFILSKSFIKIVTFKNGNKSAEKSKEKAAEYKVSNQKSCLLRREFKRFASSPVYILNCGIGIIFMIAAAIALLIKADSVSNLLTQLKSFGLPQKCISVFALSVICLLSSSCYFTAPSISLEGNKLWILKSLPLDPREIFAAKQKMHHILAGIPTVVFSVIAAVVLKMDFTTAVFMIVAAIAFVQLSSAVGLYVNLQCPNLNWTNEAVPIKQSVPVLLVFLGGWVVSIAFSVVYYLLRKSVEPDMYIMAIMIITVFVTRFINKLINTKGVEFFKNL